MKITEEEYRLAQADVNFAIRLTPEKYGCYLARRRADYHAAFPAPEKYVSTRAGSGGGADFPYISAGIIAAAIL